MKPSSRWDSNNPLDVRQNREALAIHVAEAEPVLRQLLARDPQLSGVEVASAGLEEAFLALTQEDKRANLTG